MRGTMGLVLILRFGPALILLRTRYPRWIAPLGVYHSSLGCPHSLTAGRHTPREKNDRPRGEHCETGVRREEASPR
ncbi:hypothetical protein F5883DRAFT_559625 [Diaporthe sp. PMI_573]|nr:hypothetical protein F5883DRAFT_559625 [Diaporthaceae sp. PMI_573]